MGGAKAGKIIGEKLLDSGLTKKLICTILQIKNKNWYFLCQKIN